MGARRGARAATVGLALALSASVLPAALACALSGTESGECMEPADFAADMPFCSSVVKYRACVPIYRGTDVARWRNHTLANKDAWVKSSWQKEWDIRKTAETNMTLQELHVDEWGMPGSVVMRFYAQSEDDPWNFVNDCAQAYLNYFCWSNFPRCDEEDRSLVMCESACENYFKSCGYPRDMWRCGAAELINGYTTESPQLQVPGVPVDVYGQDENGTMYFLRSFFPGQPFRANQFAEDGVTPLNVCTPSLLGAAPRVSAPALLLAVLLALAAWL
jgi:hypothetical protein